MPSFVSLVVLLLAVSISVSATHPSRPNPAVCWTNLVFRDLLTCLSPVAPAAPAVRRAHDRWDPALLV